MDEKCSFEEKGCIIQTQGDPILQTSLCCTEVLESETIILNSTQGDAVDSHQYCSTPLMNKDGMASRVGRQDVLLEYKSFFAVECEDIINQLQQGWRSDKRKLEEFDFSTIEAEPPPFCCTPNSVLDDTTNRAKRRRINDPASSETESPFYLTQRKSNPVCQSMEKSNDELTKLSSVAPKCKLSKKTSRKKYAEYKVDSFCQSSVGGFVASVLHVPGEQMLPQSPPVSHSTSFLKNAVFLKEKKYPEAKKPAKGEIDLKSPGSSILPLEFRSFFFTECENIYNLLKSCDAKKPVHDVSTIDAEPPPNLSSNITFLSEMDSSHAKANATFGVTQLNLEKLNLNQDASFFASKPSDKITYSSNTTDPVKVTVASTMEDMGNIHSIGSVANITQDIVTVCDGVPIECASQDTVAVCDGLSASGTIQDIVTICDGQSVANATQDIVTVCDGMNVTQDIVTVSDKVSVSNAILDVITAPGKVFTASAMQDIEKEHGNFVANSTQDVKMAQDISVANATQEIVPMCDKHDSNATPNSEMLDADAEPNKILTLCIHDYAAGSTLNLTTTHSFQAFEPKCIKAPFPSTMCNKSSIHCVLSAADLTNYTDSCMEAPVSDTTQDIVTVHGKVCIGEEAQGTVLHLPVAQNCVLMADDATFPKRAHDAINVNKSIKNMTFLCAAKKPDQNGVTVGESRDFVHTYKESISELPISPLSAINSTVTTCNSDQVYTEGSTTIPPNMPSACWAQATKDVVLKKIEGCNNISPGNAMANSSEKHNIFVNQEMKESNITLPIQSRPSVATIDSNQLETDNNTDVIAANYTLLSVPRVTQAKQKRDCRMVSTNGMNRTDSICDLDGTHIVNEESVFCEGSFSFITSTPLSHINIPVFIKKSSDSVQSSPKLLLNQVQKEKKQMAIPKPVSSGLPTMGNFTMITKASKNFSTLCPSKNSFPKEVETLRLPKPVTGLPTVRYPVASITVINKPQITRSVAMEKAPGEMNRRNRIPANTSTCLPRRNVGIAQKSGGNTANGIPPQKDLANCFRAGKCSVIMEGGGGDTAAPSFARPSVQVFTPANRIHSGKIRNVVSGPSSTAHASKASFIPTPRSVGSRTSGFKRPILAALRTPAGPFTSSKLKPPGSALPVRKMQAAPISRNIRGPK